MSFEPLFNRVLVKPDFENMEQKRFGWSAKNVVQHISEHYQEKQMGDGHAVGIVVHITSGSLEEK